MTMKLQDFVKEAIVQIMQGMYAADEELKENGVGNIYMGDYEKTMAQTLVNLRIVKGKDHKGVLILGFDVAVAVQEQSEHSAEVDAGVGTPFLSVVGIKAGIEGRTGQTQRSSNAHRITFSVPVTFNASNTSSNAPRESQ